MLEKNILIEQFRHEHWNVQELLQHLVRQPLSPMYRYLCKKFHIDIKNTWRVAIVEWEDYKKVNEEIMREVLLQQKKSHLVGLDGSGRLLWLLPGNMKESEVKSLYSDIVKRLGKLGLNIHILLAVGADTVSAKGLPASYESALQLLVMGKLLDKAWIYFEHYILALSLLYHEDTWYGERLLGPVDKLFEEDKNHQLIKTLRAFITCNGEVNRCAEKIVVHRNTLRYRLEKIHNITGLDPYNFQELFSLFAGLIIFRYRKLCK